MMMDGWGGGYGGTNIFGLVFMLIFMVAIIAAIVLLVIWLFRQTATAGTVGGGGAAGGESALDILNKRYARGEIDKVEYEERKKILSG